MDNLQKAAVDFFKQAKLNFSSAGAAVNKRGETFELKAELNADTRDRRKEAVKKVIANMTVGKDVSMLFADVVKNMQTEDLELKKLVYLYLMNYAKSQPELVILAVNTFVKDVDDVNPLIRALAIRTMGCLSVGKIVDYLCEPLKKALKDQDPYVRKTAAVCVAKLYDLNATLTVENGLIQTLQDLLSDPNPMVIANAVGALLEIRESSSAKRDVFHLNSAVLNKLLAALNECTEWGQISILEAFASYTPADHREAELVAERVVPRLQHANVSLVLCAVKVIFLYLDHIKSEESRAMLLKKLSPPLVTMLSSPHEVQYVALRNINLILQKRNDILSNEIRVFFCKYNDPPYVKMEKLEILIKLVDERNVDQFISEMKEYASEVDVEFVRKSVEAIGRCAIKIEAAAERCVNALLDLIKNKVNYVVQETIIVVKDIFRKYPNRYESIIPTLCENLESLDEPNAKAAMIWIIGEYAQRIDNAKELIEYFLETFKTETHQVQLQLLTAAVKLFLKKPKEAQQLVQQVLQTTTTTGESADLRDKAYIYWRLLSASPQAAKTVVLADRPALADEAPALTPTLLNELLLDLSTIASVYHRPPSTFLSASTSTAVSGTDAGNAGGKDSDDEGQQEGGIGDLLDLDFGGEATATSASPNATAAVAAGGSTGNILDLLGSNDVPAVSPVAQQVYSPTAASQLTLAGHVPPKTIVLAAGQAKGLEIAATFSRKQGNVQMHLSLSNKSLVPLSDFAVQFNKNSFGLKPAQPLAIPHPIAPNQSFDAVIQLASNQATHIQKMDPINALQIAIKNNVDIFYFQALLPVHVLFAENGLIADQQAFMSIYSAADCPSELLEIGVNLSFDDVKTRLSQNNVFFVHQTGPGKAFVSLKVGGSVDVAGEVMVMNGQLKMSIKSHVAEILPCVSEAIASIVSK